MEIGVKESLLLHPAYYYKFIEKVGTWNNKVRNHSGAAKWRREDCGPI
jgi:hypothetical protein